MITLAQLQRLHEEKLVAYSRENEPIDADAALKDTIFADEEPFDAETFVEEVCG